MLTQALSGCWPARLPLRRWTRSTSVLPILEAWRWTDWGRVTVGARREGDQLVLAVADTGRGIPADEVDTIFDEYRQVKGSDREQKGTGLGLAITKGFAELLVGSISVVSEVGKGSTFTVRLP